MPFRPKVLRFVLFCASMALGTVTLRADFTVSGRKLLRDGEPFTIRGVCYNPTPIGDNGSRAPNGDYYTAAFSTLWDRDLPNLRALGANVIRIYGWNPTADHTAFLDRCYNGGDHPIHVLVNYWVNPATDWTHPAAVQGIKNDFLNIESRLGDHPAVLGLIVGNEVNSSYGNGGKTSFWSAMNSVAASIKSANPKRLVSIAVTDALAQVAAADAVMTSIDFWCMQLYRGTSFGSFFSDFAARSARPVVVSEYGLDAFNHATNTPYPDNGAFAADTLANLWIELVKASDVTPGGCVFEYCDEWFRAPGGTDVTQDPGGWSASGFPDGTADEEWWGLFSIADNGSGPNVLSARAAYAELAALWNPPTAPVLTKAFPDPSFESVSVGSGVYSAFCYNPAVAGWTFSGSSGIAGNGSGFTSGNAAAPDGTQVAFVQMTGSITAQLTLSAGTYAIGATIANRANYGGRQSVSVRLDGVEIGRFSTGGSYIAVSTPPFTVAAGDHTVGFVGLSTTDATLFLDALTIASATAPVAVTVGTDGFETPSVGTGAFSAYTYRPATTAGIQDWRFEGASGVAGNGSAFTSANPPAPAGKQVAFIQKNTGVLSQAILLPSASSFSFTCSAAKRGSWDQGHQVVQLWLDASQIGVIAPAGIPYETITVTFAAPAGAHVLSLRGTATDDSTLLVDDVRLIATP